MAPDRAPTGPVRDAAGDRATACAECAAPRDAAALDGAVERDADGVLRWTCSACAREHLRAIEGKLAREWW